jgi:hypothetical protein
MRFLRHFFGSAFARHYTRNYLILASRLNMVTARIEVYVCVLALCIDFYVVILGGHAGLMVVMPSLTAQFCMGKTHVIIHNLFSAHTTLCMVAHSNSYDI